MSNPALSLILCSRNDQYMGNSRWRLQTTLNYVAQMVQELGRDDDVEVLVADWGSETPLHEVLELSPAAARLVSFILIPPEIAHELQKDSPFAEVLALNAAARRASGKYIGRIDQDTLVGNRFMEYFFDLHEGKQQFEVPVNSALLFANQRMVPYRFAVRCPPFWAVEKYVRYFGRFFKIEVTTGNTFYCHGVGIWLAHRDLWDECGGYDERMIYMNSMEINMISRLLKKYKMVNLGQLVNYAFYHLEHYHPAVPRRSSTHRMVNPDHLFAEYDILNPNGPGWGLVQYHFEKRPYSSDGNKAEIKSVCTSPLAWLFFIFLITYTGVQIATDKLFELFRTKYTVWKRRARIAWETVRRQPLLSWPRSLVRLWKERTRPDKDTR
jgi:hypothetical protein